MKYRANGREHRLTFGGYPELSLGDAREARDEARKLLRTGIDPKVDRKQKAAVIATAASNDFETIAREWRRRQKKLLTERYHDQVLNRLETDVFPALGALPIKSITPALVLAVIRAVEARGAIEMAHRVRQHISAVFVYAIGASLADTYPASIIQTALQTRPKTLRPAVLKLGQARHCCVRSNSRGRPIR